MNIMLRVFIIGALGLTGIVRAGTNPSILRRELISADQKAEKILQDGRDPGYTPLGFLRLLARGKMKPINLQFAIASGLQKAIPIMAKAKADLDAALKSHHKVNGPMAATFLARYAWFRAAYASHNHGYPQKRFRRLIGEALSLDPNNVQALLMRAWSSYELHSKIVLVPWPGGKTAGGQINTVMSDRSRKRVHRTLEKILKIAPDNFEAWYLRWMIGTTTDRRGKIRPAGGRTWLGILNTAKKADLYYFGLDRTWIHGKSGIVHTARQSIKWYPKYYGEYAKHKASQ